MSDGFGLCAPWVWTPESRPQQPSHYDVHSLLPHELRRAKCIQHQGGACIKPRKDSARLAQQDLTDTKYFVPSLGMLTLFNPEATTVTKHYPSRLNPTS